MATENNNKTLNVPNLRFPEFSGEWEKYRLKDIANISKERIGINMLSNNNYISTENMKPDFGGVDVAINLPASGNVIKFQKGDTLLSNIRPYLKKIWQAKFDGGCSADIFVFRSNILCNSDFLYYTLANEKFILYAMSGAKGVKMPRGDKEQILKYDLHLPTTIEQNKIASMLSLLDDRIATQIKIIEDLKKLKSAISNKYLYDKSWPKYKISEIATLGRGRVISSKEIGLQRNPIYPVYSSQTSNDGVMGYLDTYDFDGEYITWTTDGANAGTVFYRNGQFNCTNVCGTIKVGESFDAYFLSTILQTATARYVSINLANPKLMNNTMASIVVRIPDIKIQKYWSSILRKMEEKLSVEATILLALQQQKQYLLAQMFI